MFSRKLATTFALSVLFAQVAYGFNIDLSPRTSLTSRQFQGIDFPPACENQCQDVVNGLQCMGSDPLCVCEKKFFDDYKGCAQCAMREGANSDAIETAQTAIDHLADTCNEAEKPVEKVTLEQPNGNSNSGDGDGNGASSHVGSAEFVVAASLLGAFAAL